MLLGGGPRKVVGLDVKEAPELLRPRQTELGRSSGRAPTWNSSAKPSTSSCGVLSLLALHKLRKFGRGEKKPFLDKPSYSSLCYFLAMLIHASHIVDICPTQFRIARQNVRCDCRICATCLTAAAYRLDLQSVRLGG